MLFILLDLNSLKPLNFRSFTTQKLFMPQYKSKLCSFLNLASNVKFGKPLSVCTISSIYYCNWKKRTEYVLWLGSRFFIAYLFTKL